VDAELMNIDEVEVYITPDGLGRAAIVRRPDAFLCIYKWIKLPAGYMPEVFAPTVVHRWNDDDTPLEKLYEDKEPLIGIYGTVEDARREVLALPGFNGASPVRKA
jgi:hypothetical protein